MRPESPTPTFFGLPMSPVTLEEETFFVSFGPFSVTLKKRGDLWDAQLRVSEDRTITATHRLAAGALGVLEKLIAGRIKGDSASSACPEERCAEAPIGGADQHSAFRGGIAHCEARFRENGDAIGAALIMKIRADFERRHTMPDPHPSAAGSISISSRPAFRPAHPMTPIPERLEAIERELVALKDDFDQSRARFGPKGSNLFNRVCDIEIALREFANAVAAALKSVAGPKA